MIKHINHERVYSFFGMALLYATPVIYILYNDISTLLNQPENFSFQINYGSILVIAILVIFTNFMLHMVMESNFEVKDEKDFFLYKSLFKKTQKIYSTDIKKVIICKENLVIHGVFETIIIVRKGFKRSLFFQEFSMSKAEYDALKDIVLFDGKVPVKYCEKSSTKPIASLFYY